MAIIDVISEDGSPGTYKAVEISYGWDLEEREKFDSGDFVKDWYNCVKFTVEKFAGEDERVMYSSSVDHFIMDSNMYRTKFLSVDEEGDRISLENDGPGLDFFVEKEDYTWEKLRARCDDE